MNIGCKIQKLRKERGISQEEMAGILGVSRQSVSKWESDLAYPETDKLIRLCEFFNVSIDSLLKNNCVETKENINFRKRYDNYHYEYKSKKTLFGLPIIHINYGRGLYVAKGIIAIGNISVGLISLGMVSLGILSLGVLCLGLISLGVLSIGFLLGAGSIAFGLFAVGAIAIGIFSVGSISIGYFSLGALSIGKFVAIGSHARGLIAIGSSEAYGTYTFSSQYDKQIIINLIDEKIPVFWNLFKELIKQFL